MKIIEIEDFVKNYKECSGEAGDNRIKTNGECIALTGKARGEISIKLHITKENNSENDKSNLTISNNIGYLNTGNFAEIRSASIGYVLKQYGMCETDTVYANIIFPIYFSNRYKLKDFRNRCLHILELCGIAHLAKEKIFALSESERFRAVVSRALITDPDIIIIDEPSLTAEGIDYATVVDLFVMLNKLGKIILLIPENMIVSAFMEQKINIAISRKEN